MAERVVLHVGTMKSGTTYLQGILFANKEKLAAQGVTVPMARQRQQLFAVRDLIGEAEGSLGRVDGRWQELVGEVARAPSVAVISVERLGVVRRDKAARAVAELGRDGARVEVAITARDLNRSLGSLWQETLQNGRSWTWPEYLAGATADRPGMRRGRGKDDRHHFWTQMNLVRMSRRWAEVVGAQNVRVVTVPPPGAPPGLLLQRFAEAVGFDPLGLVEGPSDNSGCGVASLEVLRRLNALLDERGLPFPVGVQARKHVLAKQVLGPRRAAEGKVAHPLVEWVPAEVDRVTRKLDKRGIAIVGDLADLAPAEIAGADPTLVPEAAVLDAAVAGLHGLHDWYVAGPGASPGAAVLPDPRTWSPRSVDDVLAGLADLVAASVAPVGVSA